MKHLFIVIMAASFTLVCLAQERGAPPAPAGSRPRADLADRPDAKAQPHEGVWKPIAAVLAGQRLPPEVLKTITLKITGERYEVTVEGEGTDKGACTLDTTTTPKRMTIKGAEGPNRGKTFLAIYEMKDARSLRICYDLSGKAFPEAFKAPKGTQLYLVGYRRQKD
jgi:uncharacterized protein (TIGR03067 family)